MAEGRQFLQKYAMHFGTFMGVYWVLKFILFPLGLLVPFLFFLYLGLTLGIPFMGYYYTKMYRDKACGGYIDFGHAWLFTMAMFMFSSILTSAAHFIYFRFIDNGHILHSYRSLIDNAMQLNVQGTEGYFTQIQESLDLFASLTPIDITLQLLSTNVFLAAFLSLFISLFIQKKDKTSVKI